MQGESKAFFWYRQALQFYVCKHLMISRDQRRRMCCKWVFSITDGFSRGNSSIGPRVSQVEAGDGFIPASRRSRREIFGECDCYLYTFAFTRDRSRYARNTCMTPSYTVLLCVCHVVTVSLLCCPDCELFTRPNCCHAPARYPATLIGQFV